MYCDEGPEFFSERISRARKPYKCCECRKRIHVGQIYWRCNGKWDGEMDSFKQHIECRDACYTILKGQGECINFGALREWIKDHPERWWYGKRLWSDPNAPLVLRERGELEQKVRNLLAQGIRASRIKPDQIVAYNSKHLGRTT